MDYKPKTKQIFMSPHLYKSWMNKQITKKQFVRFFSTHKKGEYQKNIKHLCFSQKSTKCRRNEGNGKPLLQLHSNNRYRQGTWKNAKISEWDFQEKQYQSISPKYLLVIVVVSTNGHKFFNTTPSSKWSLISLPLNRGWTLWSF